MLDALQTANLDCRDITKNGFDRDEYPAGVGREIRWLVETGATTVGNGPGSLRTETGAQAGGRGVGSGAERQRYRAAPIGSGDAARR